MRKLICFFILLSSLMLFKSKAQETLVIVEPLFEYPVAPEELETLQEKCNYIVKNFWNDFNFKNKTSVDQNALNDAFMVYSSSFPYAAEKEVHQSVNKLIDKISGNPTLLFQFCKAAEENLYGPRASIWSDEIYLKFLDAIVKNKKIIESRKIKYLKIYNALHESQEGKAAPPFQFTDRNGEIKKYFPMSTPTLLIFGDPENTDWRLARLKMDSDNQLEEMLVKGKVNIIYIVPKEINNWQNTTSNYNPRWTVGQSLEVSEHYDIRVLPSLYLISTDGKIYKKNVNLQQAVNFLTNP